MSTEAAQQREQIATQLAALKAAIPAYSEQAQKNAKAIEALRSFTVDQTNMLTKIILAMRWSDRAKGWVIPLNTMTKLAPDITKLLRMLGKAGR